MKNAREDLESSVVAEGAQDSHRVVRPIDGDPLCTKRHRWSVEAIRTDEKNAYGHSSLLGDSCNVFLALTSKRFTPKHRSMLVNRP